MTNNNIIGNDQSKVVTANTTSSRISLGCLRRSILVSIVLVIIIVGSIVTVCVIVRKPKKTNGSNPTTTDITSATTTTQWPLVAASGTVRGIWNTTIGGNSRAATTGSSYGQYPATEGPPQTCDNNLGTKYLSFGPCLQYSPNITCGRNTGFYVELHRGLTLVTGLRLCTANDLGQRDPVAVSLEGSNLSGAALTLGSSWTLIYKGSGGLQYTYSRYTCGSWRPLNNTIYYKSYRFLVSTKRASEDSVQYAEVQLYGY